MWMEAQGYRNHRNWKRILDPPPVMIVIFPASPSSISFFLLSSYFVTLAFQALSRSSARLVSSPIDNGKS